MVSAAWATAGRESVLGAMGKWLGRELRRSGRTAGAALLIALRLLLVVAGLGAIVVGVYQASHVAGWIVGGVALLVLEYTVKRR